MKTYALRSMLSRIAAAGFMALTVLCLTSVASAQVNTIAFNQFQSTYSEITGTPVAMTSGTDDAIYPIPVGFSFSFNGVNHTTVYACTNGYIAMGGTASTQPYMYPNPMSYTATVDAVLCPWGGDLDGKTAGTLSYQTTGTAPYRVLTIQWKNWTYWSSSYAGTLLNFQVRMYETSGQVEYIYGACTQAGTAPVVYVGMRGPLTTDYQTRTLTAGDWVNSLKGTTNTATMTFNATTKPQSGLIYRWGCYVDNSKISFDIVDQSGVHLPVLATPSTTNFRVRIGFPNEAFTATVQLDFFLVGGSPTPVYSYTTTLSKPVTDLDQIFQVSVPQLPSGYYRINALLTTKNSCSIYENVMLSTSTLAIQSFETPCIVWPGDVNNDGLVNYGDRSALNKYIFDANLRPTWLQGPGRYRSDAAGNPLAYLTWEAQAGVPWATPQGCYMDADGNGTVNNFDLNAIKVNFLKSNGAPLPKQGADIASSFSLSQNYPNPFNPSTTIRLYVPEASLVSLQVSDMLGRTVATLVKGRLDAGSHDMVFDASALESGTYLATVVMNGTATGQQYTNTIKMTLSK